MFTIAVEPSRTAGKVTARSSDGYAFKTTVALLEGARHLQARNGRARYTAL